MVIKFMIIATVFFALLTAYSTQEVFSAAKECDEKKCVLPKCRCISTNPPGGLKPEQVPQFVTLTFDDAVQAHNHEFYSQLFDNKTNPDGSAITATFFISHEYTDYSMVNSLYLKNHEIALHSISHYPLTGYWQNISVADLKSEFGDEMTIFNQYGKIPKEAIKGMRLPFLQLSGDNSFQAAKELGLKYDCSWPTANSIEPGIWPYTLDYASTQECSIGPCPTSSIPGMWVVPMLDWTDQAGVHCSMQDACTNIPNDTDGILKWMTDNFNRQYKGNKAPFGLYIHAAWFEVNKARLEAYGKFVDYLRKLKDVYIVNIARLIEWMEKPVPIGSADFPKLPPVQDLGCTPRACELKNDKGELRYLTHCMNTCPISYPWMHNPYGNNTV